MSEYIVTADDTLEKISLAHDLTTSELMRANRLHSRILFTGQKLKIPDRKASTASIAGRFLQSLVLLCADSGHYQ